MFGEHLPDKWDNRFMELAKHIKTWSKDESTKVAAVIVDDDHHVRAISYNGFPKNIKDDERLKDRETKYRLIQHAEVNAIGVCAKKGIAVEGLTMIVTSYPCTKCAGLIITAGIKHVVALKPSEEFLTRWGDETYHGLQMLQEAGVETTIIED